MDELTQNELTQDELLQDDFNQEILESKDLSQYKPLGAWAHFGYTLLYSIPIVGLIFLIVNACSNKNINRRNHARGLLITIAFAFVLQFISGVIIFSTASKMTNDAINSMDIIQQQMESNRALYNY